LAIVFSLFFVVPLALTIVVSFWDYNEYEIIPGFIFSNYEEIFEGCLSDLPELCLTFKTYLSTLKFCVTVWLLTLVIGFAIAYFLCFHVRTLTMQVVLFLLCTIPFWTSNVIRMISWIPLLGRNGLVNNAVLVIPGPLETLPLAALREQLEVNLFGVFQVTRILLPYLRAGRGRLVNVGSDSGRIAFPLIGAYNISKFALRGMTDTFRRELALWNLPVSLIEPGPVKTPIWDRAHEKAAELAYSLSEADRELYMDLYRAMERISAEEGEQGLPPETIARTIFHALTARKPRAHYLVGTNRFLFPLMEKWIPARLLDRLILRKLGLRPRPR
ncbi:MAG: SDR family NAD(P)-dependent oxidoreductase, partial [Planctomycetota bacterium]